VRVSGLKLADLHHVLCLGAHADDLEIGCGGTLLRLLDDNPGLEVSWVVLSGSPERSAEAAESATALLAKAARASIRLADFRETYFPYLGSEIKTYVAALGTEIQPDLIFTHSREDLHQDHRVTSELTWNTFRDHLILEYEVPKWDGDLGRPNVFVPLESAVCLRKVEHLLRVFPSQRDKDWFDAEVFRGLMRLRGMEARSPSGYAEAFFCRKLVLG
jgi:LmbE family N-acetylglucosaminyl deacetylase